MDRQQDVIRRITAHVVGYRFQLENERHERERSMSRLTEKLALAAAVAPRQAAKIEARADRILAREPGIEQRTDDVFVPHERLMDEAEQGLDGLDAALRLMSNNPPLEHSTPSPSASVVTPEKISALAEAAKNYDETAVTVNLSTETTDRVALGPHPDQPEVDTGALKTTVIGNATNQYADAVAQLNKSTDRDIAEVEKVSAATFRAAE